MEEFIKVSKVSRCLASLAVFRELLDSQKDVYGIIAEFLREIIVSKAKHQFGLTEITNLLNDTYDFNILEAVAKTSLNRLDFLEKAQHIYTVQNIANVKKQNLDEKQSKIQQSNDLIIERLFTFIEEEKNEQLNKTEKEKIVNSFCSFLLDDSYNQEYSEYISTFIIKNKKDNDFTNKLNTIKEGVVLYSGIKYNNNLTDVGSWDTNLTIFVETEILFHFAGYNGELYKTLFNDFFSFVKEINQKGPKKLIQLKYFPAIKEEIECFFRKAESIVNGKDIPNPAKTAMTTILEGCHTASDIITKKTLFYQLLKTSGIQEDNYSDYFSSNNHKYNIVDKEIIDSISKSIGVEDITDCLKFLNFVSIRRKESNNNNFDNIGYILLSGNFKTIKVAWHEKVKSQGRVPLATTLDFLTNKFWFKLNKGFGKNNYPKSFDVITKAQIILSTQLNNSVGKQYEELKTKFKEGKLTEEDAVAVIVELRKKAKRPEEIHEYEMRFVLDSITEGSVEKFIQEQEHFKNRVQKQEEEIMKLKQDLSSKEQELSAKELGYQNQLDQKERKNNEKGMELQRFYEQEKSREEKREKRKKICKRIVFLFLVILFIASGVFIYLRHNKLLGIIVGIIPGSCTILTFLGINSKVVMNFLKKKL